jgi:predicted MFS family arabinose efflux permease
LLNPLAERIRVLWPQVWGWRSTFICLTIAAGVIVLPMLMLVVPETHQVT